MTPPLGRMAPYGAEHLSMLVLIAVATIAAVLWARRADRDRASRLLRTAGWAVLVNAVLWTAWGFMPWAWNIHESLPLHFTDAIRFLVPLAMITQRPGPAVVLWFWGLTLNMQSALTPDLNYFVSVPLEFGEYWFCHGIAVVVPAVLAWGLDIRPTWRRYGIALTATLGWAALAFTVNLLIGTNYAYLNRAPVGPSVLDLLGPWPWYLLGELVLIASAWALMTWPWTRSRSSRGGSTASVSAPGAHPGRDAH